MLTLRRVLAKSCLGTEKKSRDVLPSLSEFVFKIGELDTWIILESSAGDFI